MKLAAMRRLRGKVQDHARTQALKRQLAALRRRRQPFYLTKADLEPILRWKLRTQYGSGCWLHFPGIGVPVASAILALVEPRRYCVVDFRGWRALFGEKRRHFSARDYRRYRTAITVLATKLGWSIQETDAVVWEIDRRRSA